MEKRDEDAFAVCRYSFGQGLNLFPNSMRGEEDGLLFYITRIFKTNFLSIRCCIDIRDTFRQQCQK